MGSKQAKISPNIFQKVSVLERTECILCSFIFEKGDIARLLPCGHLVHDLCITNRSKDYETCVCREKLF